MPSAASRYPPAQPGFNGHSGHYAAAAYAQAAHYNGHNGYIQFAQRMTHGLESRRRPLHLLCIVLVLFQVYYSMKLSCNLDSQNQLSVRDYLKRPFRPPGLKFMENRRNVMEIHTFWLEIN